MTRTHLLIIFVAVCINTLLRTNSYITYRILVVHIVVIVVVVAVIITSIAFL